MERRGLRRLGTSTDGYTSFNSKDNYSKYLSADISSLLSDGEVAHLRDQMLVLSEVVVDHALTAKF